MLYAPISLPLRLLTAMAVMPLPPRPVILAVAAAACFGTALYCIDRGARYALLETLWGMRATSVFLFLIAGLAVRSVGGVRRRDLPALAAIGLGDVTANGLFAFSSSRGMVSVASVLGSLYPIATLFWARILLGERLRRVQTVGVGMTLVGVVDADLGLQGGDLRAAERSFQQIQQVAGRAGRGD